MIRVGILGAGRIVERAHLPLLREQPDVALTALYDPLEARVDALGTQFAIPCATTDLATFLETRPDVVLVACPNFAHAAMAIAAMDAGAHVLCEKPMAPTIAEAEAMQAAALRTGRTLAVGFPNRFRPEIQALKVATQANQFGTLQHIRATWLRRGGVPGAGTWFTDLQKAGGGALLDLGSHMLDLALWLSGPQQARSVVGATDHTSIHGEASWYQTDATAKPSAMNVEVGARGMIACQSGLTIGLEVSWDCGVPHDRTELAVIGTHGAAEITTLFGFSPSGIRPPYPGRFWIDDTIQEIAGDADLLQPYRGLWRWYLDAVAAGDSLRQCLEEQIATVRLIAALYHNATLERTHD